MPDTSSTKYKVACKNISNPGGSPLEWKNRHVDSIREAIHSMLDDLNFGRSNLYNRSILLHPNLVRPHRQRPASFTDPRVILAVADVCRDFGAKSIAIGENPGFGFSSEQAFKEAGLVDALKERHVTIRHLDQEEWVSVENTGGRLYRKVKIAKSVIESDIIINIPKMKTHMLTGVSLCIKNLLGAIPDEQRQIFHRNDIADKVVDLNLVRSPDLNIVDGLWAMEGQAPFNGDTIEDFNWLIAGEHAAAVDAVTCQFMGLRPEEIPHVQLGCQRLLVDWPGVENVTIIGDSSDVNRHVFKRPILSSMAQFKGINCIECGVCRGCLSAVRHSLDWLKATGELDGVPLVTIVSGRSMPNMSSLETWDGQLILFGNCAAEFQFFDPTRRQKSIFVPGCAPHVLDLAGMLKELSGSHSNQKS